MNADRSRSQMVVFTGVGEPLEVTHVGIPELEPAEVLIKVTCCTICGSDLHTFSGRRSGAVPTVLGHEIIGIVADIGHVAANQLAEDISIGDRVTWSIAASCGTCGRCENDLPQKCESLFKYGHEEFNSHPFSGGLSQYCVLEKGTRIVKLSDQLPDEVACPANCATATVAAAIRTCGDVKGKRVLIVGAGMLGLTACAFASVNGAAEITVCELDESRLQKAAQFGATRLVRTIDEDSFDCVFEISGSSAAVEQSVRAATTGGVVVLVGSVSPSKSVSIDPEQIVRRLMTIHGVHNYKPDDLVTAVDFLERHHQQFPFARLVESSFGLAEAQAALEYAEAKRPIRVAVRP